MAETESNPSEATAPKASHSPEDSNNDKDLVRRVLAGETDCYEELVRKHQPRVYATLYNMTSNHEDAADLAQEAFVKAFQALKSFKGDSS
ncbi:MAG: RNA polymerase subunit sigma-24, partial [Verrucomicrobia bacterium]|nr:RNA polymerase subunit sigma-24 [Verrucomicrobiota bacterium]